MTAEPFLAFLDANVLARPVTRTLLLLSGPPSGFAPVWSATVEAEADRHLRLRQKPVAELRPGWGMALSPTGSDADAFVRTSPKDRQVLADAVAADALFLVTDDVDDFAAVDLASAGIAAVGPDLFLSERTTKAGYREAIEWLSARMTSPQRTPSKLHGAISRRHPRLRSRHADVYPGAASPVVGGTPQVEFRGDRCLRCLARVEAPTNAIGLCAACATAVAGGHNAKPKPAWRAGGTK